MRLDTSSIPAHSVNSALLPFAVTCTALYLGLGLLPFAPAGVGWPEALGLLPSRLAIAGLPALPVFLALPLGFFWQGAAWPRAASARPAAAAAVFLLLGLLAVLLQLGQIHFPPLLATPAGLPAPLLGFAAGMALWWLLGPSLSRRPPGLPTWFWPALAATAALSALLPLDPRTSMSAPALPGSLSAYATDIPQRLYLLIKSSILWVPVGFLYALSGRGAALPRWGVALAVALILEGVPLLLGQPLLEVLELLFALPGLWFGAWLGERSLPQWAPAVLSRAPRARREVEEAIPEQRPSATRDVALEPGPPAAPEPARTSARRSRRRKHRSRPKTSRHSYLLPWLAGSLMLLAALVGVAGFSLWQWGLGLGLMLYMAALWVWPLAWLVVVPAALPLLDFAPWSGRFFFDEFDFLMLATAGILLLKPPTRQAGRVPLLALSLYLALAAVALLASLGNLLPLPALDANAFSAYWSPYNSLRVAKSFLWGGLIMLLIRRGGCDLAGLGRLLAIGMGIGLLGVSLVGLWERWLYAGLSDGAQTYRITSLFSSMHTGGGHIEAYLVAALPFLWLGTTRARHLALTLPLMLLVTAILVYTVSRGGALALGVALAILAIASLRLSARQGWARLAAPLGILLLLAVALGVGVGGGYFQKRLAQAGDDWRTRVDHWSQALAMRDDKLSARLFGMGLGSFPRVYLERGPVDKQPATYGFVAEKDNTFLRLGSGETMYYAQRVQASAGQTYRLSVDIRGHQNGERLALPLCEKQMLDSRACVWTEFTPPGDGLWHRHTRELAAITVGAGGPLRHPPVELSLYHPGSGGTVDIDNLRLLDAGGHELLCNGGFERGGDCWFFKTHVHLPWHIKNLWVHLLFEQGWLGLALFSALTLLALARSARAAWNGSRLAWVVLASLSSLLTVGMFDSLLDAPRLATLLLLFLLLGGGLPWAALARTNTKLD
ncbi:MAG: O-antigen ligase family protein [Gallionellaceae bacterium]|nr:O-antigen ligase family protein [Gallionellaceae bacterium]